MTKAGKFWAYIFLVTVALLSAFPLIWMAISSTNTSNDILAGRLVPGNNFVKNIQNLTSLQPLWRAMWNSFRNALMVTIVSVMICSLAGYGFEIYHNRNKDRVFKFLLLSMMVPFAALMIPLFQMFAQMKLLNTTTAIVLPTVSTAVMIMLFRQNARSFPNELVDASRIDGLNEFEIYLRVFIPTMKSTYGAATTVIFMNAWNSYLWPKVALLQNESITMPMLVSNLTAGYVVDYGVLMMAVFISTLPTAIIFFLLQRSFAEGISGAVKG